MFSLHPQSGIPIYRQIMEQVHRMVSSGQLKPGDALPSVRELALTHAVNAMTISKAYSHLESEGLLLRQRGKPMTISTQTKRSESKKERLKRLQPAVNQLAMAVVQLELKAADVVDALNTAIDQEISGEEQ